MSLDVMIKFYNDIRLERGAINHEQKNHIRLGSNLE